MSEHRAWTFGLNDAAWLAQGKELTCECPLKQQGGCVVTAELPSLGEPHTDPFGSTAHLLAALREFDPAGTVTRTALGWHRDQRGTLRAHSWVLQCAVAPARNIRPVRRRWISPTHAELQSLYARLHTTEAVGLALGVSGASARTLMREAGVAMHPGRRPAAG
ncbi:hypothetical protein [Kitasatospora viridis]|uniref:Uncharacterized protein n=1 Tax=Kitasatospora viridis TaxID=281105 RepID=A0A561T6Y8_9ACTN|nr:hypothetical protein [Kitasatospora viridis]TWF82867.1 hypothetical protein FHX73_14349 [Kitasatospora viridis]